MLMNRIPLLVSILILLVLSACQLPMPGVEAPTSSVSATETPFVAGAAPTDTVAAAPVASFTDTAPPPAAAPATEALPTATPFTAAQPPQSAESQPTATQPAATQPAPTATPTPVATFDPYTALGTPTYQNPMEFPNLREWAQPEKDTLPDNRDIRLQFKDGQLYVTGKRPGFSTWWFSYHSLGDAFIEMTFNSEDCSDEDAYGIIFRGPPHLAGQSYGYVVSFTCDEKLWVYRLDGVDPWDAENLIDEEEQDAIDAGSDARNVLGVRAEGDQFVIYANGRQIAEVEDDHFEKGRVGVFVRAADFGGYTYRVTNFAYWILGGDE
jgi:hypothetical protein